MKEITIINVVLSCGDRFVYGGEKTIDELLSFLRWETPTNVLWKDDRGNMHLFHSSKIEHIYEEKVFQIDKK